MEGQEGENVKGICVYLITFKLIFLYFYFQQCCSILKHFVQ